MSQEFRRGRQQNEDWAREVPWTRGHEPYEDYGWEQGESVLPEFREPDVHVQPYERRRVGRWRPMNWNRQYNYGIEESGPYSGVGPKGYQRSDERIFEDVCDRLTRNGQIDASRIRVKAKDGEVILDGIVPDRRTKRLAEMVAESVSGVKDIHNQLHIDQRDSGVPGGGKGRVDEVGGSGVYPASGPMPPNNAPVQGEASWGQGERGAAGYEDSGESELHIPPENKGKS